MSRVRTISRIIQTGVGSIALIAASPAAAQAGGAAAKTPSPHHVHEAIKTGRWALLIALAFLIVGLPLIGSLLGWIPRAFGYGANAQQPKPPWGCSLIVGQDNRVSTSKTAALVWTYTLAAALLSFIVARWIGYADGYKALVSQSLNAQYAVLIGGPLGAAILAKGIVSSQVDSGSSAKPPADSASPAQLVQNDSGGADLGDVQYLLFNVVALVFFYGELLRAPQMGMPTIPDVLVGLTSVAAVGFVGKKALAGPAGIGHVHPKHAAPGDWVTIVTSGIIKSASDLPVVTVMFGDAVANPARFEITTTTTQAVLLKVKVPGAAQPGRVVLTVSGLTGTQARWPNFEVVPRRPS